MHTPRIMLAGTGSNCGKTTMTCALLSALRQKGLDPVSFKCGPDYIDPMFHSEAVGVKSRNLDLFLLGEEQLKALLVKNSADKDLAVIEGVMGFYDGRGSSSEHSAWQISELSDTPVLLVVGCKGMSVSAAAIVKGFLDFAPNQIKGVLLNGVSKAIYPYYKGIIESYTPLPVLGYLPHDPRFGLGSRHLGLVTPDEIDEINQKLLLLGQTAAETLDIDGILKLAQSAKSIDIVVKPTAPIVEGIRIAVARDKAFCFYYEDSLQLLRELGARLVEFSPLADASLPEGVSGLLLGGGYPEVYAKELSANTSMLHSIRCAVQSGLPTIAECGGFMYLSRGLKSGDGLIPLVGAIDTEVYMTEKLQRFGYITLTAEADNLLCFKGEQINAHEFHYSDASDCGEGFSALKQGKASYPCTFSSPSLYAGYPHLHLAGKPDFAKRYLLRCQQFHRNK